MRLLQGRPGQALDLLQDLLPVFTLTTAGYKPFQNQRGSQILADIVVEFSSRLNPYIMVRKFGG